MRPRRAGSLGRRLARWLALLTLVGLALTCLGIYTVTALSFKERQMDTLRQQQIQVNLSLLRQQGWEAVRLHTSLTMAWSADRT